MFYKKKKKKMSRAQRKKQQQRYMYLGLAGLTAACVAAVMLMGMVNREASGSRYTYTTENDIWYLEEGEVQVAAPAAEEAPVVEQVPDETIESSDFDVTVPEDSEPQFIGLEALFGEPPEVPVEEEPVAEEPVNQEPVRILISATGDCTLGTYKPRNGGISAFKSFVEKYGYDYFFANVSELFAEDDLTIVNLEGPLTNHNTKRPRRTFNFRGYPEWAKILMSGNVDICNLANNHALDYKEEGFKDTCKALEMAGIGASGYGPEYYTEVKGYTVGSLGFTEWNFEAKDILAKVKAANEKCDLLIVSMHWNKEHEYRLSSYCRKMGRALVDAGADLVIGNHSHVYGEIEIYNGKYIINSLGNFVFGGNDDPYVRECAIFRQEFLVYPDGTVEDGGIDIIPCFLSSTEKYNDFQPRIAEPDEGREILYAIAGLSPGMTPDNVLWMEDSYVVKHGILTAGAQAVTPSPEPTEEPTTEPTMAAPQVQEAEPTPEMAIAQDIAL